MKLCGACCIELSKEKFSKNQWKAKQHQRRCRECINENRGMQLAKPTPEEQPVSLLQYLVNQTELASQRPRERGRPKCFAKGESFCWICLEEGSEESPLRRDCSCRGDSGFAHLNCIVEYAFKKNTKDAWEECPNCNQEYQNKLALDLTSVFVNICKCPLFKSDESILTALHTKMTRLFLAGDRQCATEIDNIAKEIIDIVKNMTSPLSDTVLFIEAAAYNALGLMIIRRGITTKADSNTAVQYLKKYQDVSKTMGLIEQVVATQVNIVSAKKLIDKEDDVHKCPCGCGAMYHGVSMSEEEKIECKRKAYAILGENIEMGMITSLECGCDLAISLDRNYHSIESERLYTKLATISCRVHGPDHSLTIKIQNGLKSSQERWVKIKSKEGYFQALGYKDSDNYDTYVVSGPIEEPRNVETEHMFTVGLSDVCIEYGTPVVCLGIAQKEFIQFNGKIGDVRLSGFDKENRDNFCYGVYFEDKSLDPAWFSPLGLRILFELPDTDSESFIVPIIS